MKSYLTTAIVLLTMAAGLRADYVEFVNGDRLSGTIVKLTDSQLTFESELAGTITADLDQIATFSSDQALEIHIQDGTVIKQPVKADEPGTIMIDETDILAQRTLRFTQIASINPPAEEPFEPRWDGTVSVGGSMARGNTRSETISASTDIQRRGENDRLTLGADYARGRQADPATGDMATTEDWWRTQGKYDYFFTEKLYAYGSGRYRTDDVANLDYRITAGGGGGYQWVETERIEFGTELGVAHITENYQQADTTRDLAVEAAYNLAYRVNERVSFISRLNYYPTFDDLSDYYLTTTQELRVSLTERIFTNFRVIFDYDSTPGSAAGSTDIKYVLGAGLEF